MPTSKFLQIQLGKHLKTQNQNQKESSANGNQNLNLKKKSSLNNLHFPLIKNINSNNSVKSMKFISTCQFRLTQNTTDHKYQVHLKKRFNKKFYLNTLKTESTITANNQNQQSNKAKGKYLSKYNAKDLKRYSSCTKLRALGSIDSLTNIPQSQPQREKVKASQQILSQQGLSQKIRRFVKEDRLKLDRKQNNVKGVSFQKAKSNERLVKSSNTIEINEFHLPYRAKEQLRQNQYEKRIQENQNYVEEINEMRKFKLQTFYKFKNSQRIKFKKLLEGSEQYNKAISLKTTENNKRKSTSQNSIELQEIIQGQKIQKLTPANLNTCANLHRQILLKEQSLEFDARKTKAYKNLANLQHFGSNQHLSIFQPSSTPKAKVLVRNPFPKVSSKIESKQKNLMLKSQKNENQNQGKQIRSLSIQIGNKAQEFQECALLDEIFKCSKIYHKKSQINFQDRDQLQSIIKEMQNGGIIQ